MRECVCVWLLGVRVCALEGRHLCAVGCEGYEPWGCVYECVWLRGVRVRALEGVRVCAVGCEGYEPWGCVYSWSCLRSLLEVHLHLHLHVWLRGVRACVLEGRCLSSGVWTRIVAPPRPCGVLPRPLSPQARSSLPLPRRP